VFLAVHEIIEGTSNSDIYFIDTDKVPDLDFEKHLIQNSKLFEPVVVDDDEVKALVGAAEVTLPQEVSGIVLVIVQKEIKDD
jgi:hypothetical protein